MPAPDGPDTAGTPDGPDAELTTVGQDGLTETTPGDDTGLGRTDWTVPTMDDMRAEMDARSATAAGDAELDALSGAGPDQAHTVEDRGSRHPGAAGRDPGVDGRLTRICPANWRMPHLQCLSGFRLLWSSVRGVGRGRVG